MGDLLFHPARRSHLRVVEQSPAGQFANIAAGTTTRYAICIGTMAYCETDSATLAARAATALDELIALGFEPSAPCVESVVRAVLEACPEVTLKRPREGVNPEPPEAA